MFCLLPPLESLATVEETIVRDKVGKGFPVQASPTAFKAKIMGQS